MAELPKDQKLVDDSSEIDEELIDKNKKKTEDTTIEEGYKPAF